jgi:SP family facilitated glucose transporter-like MFS transporter 8
MKGDFEPDGSTADLAVMTDLQFDLYGSLLNIGAVLGAFSGSFLADTFGRRNTLASTAFPFVVCWGLTYFLSSFYALLFLRVVTGWTVGVGSAVTPIYINEIATPSVKGKLGAANQLFVTIGILIVNVLGSYVFVTEDSKSESVCQWRDLSLMVAVITFFLLFAMLLPESPRWLAKKGNSVATINALARLRKGDSLPEAHEMLAEAGSGEQQVQSEQQESLMSRLRKNRKGLIAGIGLLGLQQLSGVNAIIFFVKHICESAGVANPGDKAVMLMAGQTVLTLLAATFMDSLGRRVYLLFGSTSMACGCFMTAFLPSPLLQIAGLAVFVVGFSFGLGPIPWLILGELFPTDVRGTAASLATAVNWFLSFLVTLVFDSMQKALGFHVFAVFGTICVVGTVFIYSLVPETRNKSLGEVLQELGAYQ